MNMDVSGRLRLKCEMRGMDPRRTPAPRFSKGRRAFGMSSIALSPGGPPASRVADGQPILRWMIFTGACAFAVVLLWRYGLIRLMIASDRTYISSIIGALYIGASLHCLWRTIVIGREGDAGRRAARVVAAGHSNFAADGEDQLPPGLVTDHIRNLALKARTQGAGRLDQTLLLRSLADRLRGSNGFGTFASDTLMKLGLLGTIIGFIIMLAPIAGLDATDRVMMKASMGLMGDGMAVAMYTTLAGLVGSILLKVQYYMLDAATARVFSQAVTLTETRVVPALERRDAR